VHSRTIYVSQNQNSTDTADCGFFNKPCNSLRQAIKISDPSDTILMDSNYVYHQNKTISIPHSLIISSYSAGPAMKSVDDKAILDFLFHFEEGDRTFFSIKQKLILTNIKLIVNPTSDRYVIVFSADQNQNVSKISIVNCVFEQLSGTEMTFFDRVPFFDAEVNKTSFVANPLDIKTRKQRVDFEQNGVLDQNFDGEYHIKEMKFQVPLPKRYAHTSHVVNDTMIVVGGVDTSGQFSTNEILLIDLIGRTFRGLKFPACNPASPLMFHNHQSLLLTRGREGCEKEGRLLVVGGGGNCFSFGTHFNRCVVSLDLSDEIKLT
uniref:Uncharacterized protein n=1 Tax=Clytia hemisphaerica TaxID=252671 RepID=A0A7M5ULR4_9CNID